jgi:hypothetical protein
MTGRLDEGSMAARPWVATSSFSMPESNDLIPGIRPAAVSWSSSGEDRLVLSITWEKRVMLQSSSLIPALRGKLCIRAAPKP